jgi:predicted AAA+ superfamily ATPase
LDRPEAIDGAALEGLVAQHLRAWIGYRAGRAELFFSRTVQGVEVDFVLYGPDGFWAIEVKNGRRVRSEDLRPLRAFRADYPECECLLLYRGPERLRIDDVLCVPCEEFLRQLRPDRGPTDGL